MSARRPRRRTLARAAIALAGGAAVIAAAGCEGRTPQAPAAGEPSRAARGTVPDASAIAELDLSRGASEAPPTSLLGSSPRRSYSHLVRSLREMTSGDAARAPKGVFVKLGTSTVGYARAQEIGALLGELRKDKPVVCHADGYDNRTMLLAAKACSKVWVSPAGDVDTVGIAAQLLFGKKLLDRLHVGADFLQIGKYKGAEEPFTRDGPSPEARASLEGTLRGLRAAWIAGVAEGRGKPELAAALEDGPYTPEDAKAKGFVDAIGYADEARDEVKKLAGSERVITRFGGGESAPGASRGVVGMLRAISGSGSIGVPHVAVVPAIGAISMSGGGLLPIGSNDGITERELGRVLTRLTGEGAVKAVVVRVDSPGGSALASDLLWQKLMKLREKKPVVFSVGEMAASGGYYLACAGTKIVAQPTSIVGSIGVVGGKLSVGKALDEIGLHAETIAAAPGPEKAARAAYMSPLAAWDDPTREKVRRSMQSVYDLFLQRIAKGRGTSVEAVAPAAEGRIFGGVEAKEKGLVDELGGLVDAIGIAAKLANLPADAPIEVVSEDGGLLDLLDGDDASARAAGDARRAAGAALLPAWVEATPEVGAFVGSMAPLLAGERALAAVPFGLVIR